jgi:hypothetical protein
LQRLCHWCYHIEVEHGYTPHRNLFIKIILGYWQICLDDFCSSKYNYFWAQLLATVMLYQNTSLVNLPWFYPC